MAEVKDIPEGEEKDWAYGYPAMEARLIREHIKLIPGYDLEKVLKGQIIERIIGDDTNTLNTANMAFEGLGQMAHLAETARQLMLRRMQWELDQDLTPVKIKESLEQVLKEIEMVEWRTIDEVSKAHRIWEEKVRRPILQMLDSNEDGIKDAQEEYRRFYDEVSARGLPH